MYKYYTVGQFTITVTDTYEGFLWEVQVLGYSLTLGEEPTPEKAFESAKQSLESVLVYTHRKLTDLAYKDEQ